MSGLDRRDRRGRGSRGEEFGGSLAANLVGVFAFVLTAFHLVQKYGYAKLLTRACVGCALAACAMAVAVYTTTAPAAGGLWVLILTYATWTFAFDVVWPVSYAVAPKLFNATERSTGFGFAQAVGKLGIAASPWVRLTAGDGGGDGDGSAGLTASGGALIFVVFGGFWLLAALAARRLVPKVTGVDKKELQAADGEAAAHRRDSRC